MDKFIFSRRPTTSEDVEYEVDDPNPVQSEILTESQGSSLHHERRYT